MKAFFYTISIFFLVTFFASACVKTNNSSSPSSVTQSKVSLLLYAQDTKNNLCWYTTSGQLKSGSSTGQTLTTEQSHKLMSNIFSSAKSFNSKAIKRSSLQAKIQSAQNNAQGLRLEGENRLSDTELAEEVGSLGWNTYKAVNAALSLPVTCLNAVSCAGAIQSYASSINKIMDASSKLGAEMANRDCDAAEAKEKQESDSNYKSQTASSTEYSWVAAEEGEETGETGNTKYTLVSSTDDSTNTNTQDSSSIPALSQNAKKWLQKSIKEIESAESDQPDCPSGKEALSKIAESGY